MAVTTCVAPKISTRKLTPQKRAELSLKVLKGKEPLSDVAKANDVSRQLLYRDKKKIVEVIKQSFEPVTDSQRVLFHLPVTKDWLEQFALSITLNCHGSVRGIELCSRELLDYPLSIAGTSTTARDHGILAEKLNNAGSLSNINVGAHDEIFHHQQPVLVTCDIESLYCAALSIENDRDGDTWSLRMMELQDQGFSPERVIADDGDGIRVGHQSVMPDIPFDLDNFHMTMKLIELRRFFRNRLKSRLSELLMMEAKMEKAKAKDKTHQYARALGDARTAYEDALHLSTTMDTLISWLEHDVFFMAGDEPKTRFECFNFIVEELSALADIHPHRIKAICTTLRNQRDKLLAFTHVLDEKFQTIAKQFNCSLYNIWQMCKLMRYSKNETVYHRKAQSLRQQLNKQFYAVEQAVSDALDSTHRASSNIENMNSRLSPYFFLRKNIDNRFLQLLRFYLNHKPLTASDNPKRKNKTPAELLHQKPHPHWLEMLGHTLFKRAA